MASLAALIPSDWREALATELSSASFLELEAFLDAEARAGAQVFPPRGEIFAALRHTPLAEVRVVIIGQDPYPTKGNANGLAFSVSPGMKLPASLKNVFKGLAADVGATLPTGGDLTPWAKQGVLLLNTVLTVREGEANSHRGKGWEPLTEALLRRVNASTKRVVFLCFGAQAQKMASALVDSSRHPVLTAPHPSPLNGRAFENAVAAERHFTRTNALLQEAGRGAIEWQIS